MSPTAGNRVTYLVSCVSKKLDHSSPARDLYISEWFRRARAYIEKRSGCWFILSAKFGLVSPTELLAPYDETLKDKSAAERLAWSDTVRAQLNSQLLPARHIVIFAGIVYRRHLIDDPRRRAETVEIPLEGLRIGEQLRWFGQQNEAC